MTKFRDIFKDEYKQTLLVIVRNG